METRSDDFYPTRLERPSAAFGRLDPVIHSTGTARSQGPLSETELTQYDRYGFLVFNNFLDPETVRRFREDLRAYENDDSVLRSEGTITEPGKQEIRSIFGIHELSERFDQLTRDPRFWPWCISCWAATPTSTSPASISNPVSTAKALTGTLTSNPGPARMA